MKSLASKPWQHAATFASLVFPAIVFGQSPASFDPVVITAARTEQRLADALPHTTVITRAEIELRQTAELVELLGRQAGVEFVRSGGPGAQSSLFVRGTNSSQVLVLVDGVRLNTSVGGAATLGGVAVDSIERIEIVRGNLSSLYGSEAIGGVIHIFTRGGETSGIAAAADAGRGDSRAASASGTASFDNTRLSATGAIRRSEPFSAINTVRAPGANPDTDGNRNRSGALRLRHLFDDRFELGASAWASRNETEFDSTGDGPTATHLEDAKQHVAQAYLRAAPVSAWATRVQAAEARDRSRNTSSNPLSFNNGEFESRNRQLTWTNDVQLAPQLTGHAGIDYLEQRGGSTSYDPTFGNNFVAFSRRVKAGWLGATGGSSVHRVQFNLRHDDYSDAGTANTGLAVYGLQFTPAWRATAQVSTAFRAPSFNDLYFPFFGNPNLKPERSRSAELGLRYAEGPRTLRLAVFRTHTRDLIVFDAVTSRAQNIARAEIDGAEIAVGGLIAGTRLEANVSATDPSDASNGQRLLRRAPYSANLLAVREFGPASLGAEISRVAARYDSDINTFGRTRLAPYTLARLVGSYRIGRAIKLKLRVENAFDEEYELVSGYNTHPRGVFLGAEVKL